MASGQAISCSWGHEIADLRRQNRKHHFAHTAESEAGPSHEIGSGELIFDQILLLTRGIRQERQGVAIWLSLLIALRYEPPLSGRRERVMSRIAGFVVLLLVLQPAGSRAAIMIDFDDLSPGVLSSGDVLKTVGGFTATVGPGQIGSVVNGGIGAPFSGNHISSVGGANNGRVDISFNTPITAISFDANYPSNVGHDFQVRAFIGGAWQDVIQVDDGPNTRSFVNVILPGLATALRFRDQDLKSVNIDNLSLSAVPEPTAFVIWSALSVTALALRRRRRR